ncbi:hypothetical protein [Methanobrevibacter sp.]|nr:hypothetical protein [Methanobrevibacter sp.]
MIWEMFEKIIKSPKITSAAREYRLNESHDAKYGNSEKRKIEKP